MRIELHHFNQSDKATADQLCWIIRGVGLLVKNMEKIMSSFDDLKAAQVATDAAVATIKADVEGLLAKLAAIPAAGLTADQQTALDAAVAHASAINASLSGVDAQVNPPAAPAA